jgi:hypothetical protein
MKYASLVVAGLVLAVAGFMVGRAHPAQSPAELFERRLACDKMADAYFSVKPNDGDAKPTAMTRIDRVDFSPARNSCIASVVGLSSSNGVTLLHYSVVDFITRETLFTGSCNVNDATDKTFCGNGDGKEKDIELRQQRDTAFRAAMQDRPSK